MDIRLVAAEFSVGYLPPERVPAVAATLLTDGWDSPALRRAAGGDGDDPQSQHADFQRALQELGQLPLTPEEAAARLTSFWAKRILEHEVPPLEGAQALWTLHRHFGVSFDDDSFWGYGALDTEEYAAPGVQEAYEQAIRDLAARWLETRRACVQKEPLE